MPTQITVSKVAPSASPTTFASKKSFAQKLLNFSISLASGAPNNQPTTFAQPQNSSAPGTVNISGVRARCRITNAGAPAGSSADIAIYGLPQTLMNQLATLGVVVDSVSRNGIIVSAGESSIQDASSINAAFTPASGFPVVFGGTIWFSYGDYKNMPDVPFRITAQGGLFNAVQSVAPSSFSGSTTVESIMQQFAAKLGVPFENNGVSAVLKNPYFPGTLLQQIYQVADHANIHAQLVDGGTKLAIWPIGGSRTSQTRIPLISPDTGMIGYPTFAQNGWLAVEMLFNPDVVFGGSIQIESSIPQANKTWTVYKLDLALDSLLPDGEWKATAICYPKGVNAPATPAVTP